MDLYESTRREKRQTFFAAIALALVVSIVAAPVVEAAVQRIKGTVTAKVKDTNGSDVESEAIGPMGILQAEGSEGALAVRNYAGGGGFLGAGDCTPGGGTATDPLNNVVTVSNAIVTGIIITGDGTVTTTSAAVGNGQVPLTRFEVDAQNPNEFVGLGNGLTATAPLTFTGTGGETCNFVILGQ